MGRISKIVLSIPRTIYFNFRYLPFHQAVKLPVWIANNVRIKNLNRGCISLEGIVRLGLVRIGYHEADGVDVYSSHTIIDIQGDGKLIFANDAHIGQGAILCAKENASLTLGSNFAVSGTTSIICSKSITFGDDVQLSWNSMVMDSDAHKIFDESGKLLNPPCSIKIGNKVWIAANTTIMKGTTLPDNVIVAANSLVNKKFTETGVIIGGQPAKVLKKIEHFEI